MKNDDERHLVGQVSSKLHNTAGGFAHWCPGCEKMHAIRVNHNLDSELPSAHWSFDGNLDSPSFSPSIHIKYPSGKVCHYFLVDGELRFCGDSTHALVGKNVPLPMLPEQECD